jgi:hypothetical protein
MSEIIIPNAIKDRDFKDKLNYNYKIDKEGNLVRNPYSIFTDPYTLVTVCVILMGLLYYNSIINNPLAIKNIDYTCESLTEICSRYIPLKDQWIQNHPGEELDVRDIISSKVYFDSPKQEEINFSSLNLSLS